MYGGNKFILWGLLAILCGRIVAELVIIGPIIAQGQGELHSVLPFSGLILSRNSASRINSWLRVLLSGPQRVENLDSLDHLRAYAVSAGGRETSTRGPHFWE